MNFDPLGAQLAVRATRAATLSARPDAPVIPDATRASRLTTTRARSAAALQTLARWVEPRPRPTKACQPS